MLEPGGREDILNIIYLLRGKVTIILITHYMEEALKADKVYVLNQGKIVLSGKPQDVFSTQNTLDNYNLDFPEVIKIKNELEECGIAFRHNVYSREELVNEIIAFIEGEKSDSISECQLCL